MNGQSSRHSLALDVAGEGMLEWDLARDTVTYSARWCELLGLPAISIVATPLTWQLRVHEDDVERLFAALKGLTAEQPSMSISYRMRHADGSYRRMGLRATLICEPNGFAARILGWQNDRASLEATPAVPRTSTGDALAILAGQATMTQQLEAAVARARHDGRSTHLFLTIDLDGFTAISASYGAEAAKRLLVAIGERLRACMRATDTIARYGCDEFCILIRCTSEHPLASSMADRIQRQLAAPFIVEGRPIAVSVSVGVARVLPEHTCGADVSRDAYAAVHQAKMLGGNQCALFDHGMHEKTRARLQFEAELRHALEREEFVLHFQPIVCLRTGKLVSLEALLRWQHPTRGCLPPSVFLDTLATMGLMTDVGRWIVAEACRQSVILRRRTDFDASISINVSPRQLLEHDFVTHTAMLLAGSGASADWIEFEITEDITLGDGEAAMRVLHDLRARGLRVRIDDFGTGYSSLSYLQRLPVEGLKIDRAFLEQLETDSHRREIVGAIIRLAHVLGLDVVAEGVEREAQLETLRELDCDFVQGYHIAQPMSAEDASLWIVARVA
jgi:diguanylate cyclase (GGDEF)-like protein